MVETLEQSLLAGIADETDLRQDGRHRRPDQHYEWGPLHAAILGRGIRSYCGAVQSRLHLARELPGLLALIALGDLLDDAAEIVDGHLRPRVLAGGQIQRIP